MDGPVDLRTDLIISKDATEVGEEDICWLALGAVLGIAAAITARVELVKSRAAPERALTCEQYGFRQ